MASVHGSTSTPGAYPRPDPGVFDSPADLDVAIALLRVKISVARKLPNTDAKITSLNAIAIEALSYKLESGDQYHALAMEIKGLVIPRLLKGLR